ncbi:hypothetical protein C6P41_000736 [Kluyveromyces marxianus]|nr:hypothetical protein C6P43_001992 [Kluyveromyces marxianus]KAG0679226.1 hypothetical protein C6P41_000736 [Kluyveromyces marxianus]
MLSSMMQLLCTVIILLWHISVTYAIDADDFSKVNLISKSVDPYHFAALFPVEIIRSSYNIAIDTKTTGDLINELAGKYDEFQPLIATKIPELVNEPIYDRIMYLYFRLANNDPVDLQYEATIIRDIIDVASNTNMIRLDLAALFKIRKEIKFDITAVSKMKMFESCLLAQLFPFMQGECEGLLREKLIEHLKIWIEVWKKHHYEE